jgi:hypothetical protein
VGVRWVYITCRYSIDVHIDVSRRSAIDFIHPRDTHVDVRDHLGHGVDTLVGLGLSLAVLDIVVSHGAYLVVKESTIIHRSAELGCRPFAPTTLCLLDSLRPVPFNDLDNDRR